MLIFISGQILAGKCLTLSENGYFLAELLLKSVAFCDSELRRNQLNGTWCYFNPSLHTLAVSADFISLSGIPYCPVFPTYTLILLARKVLKIHLSAFPGTPGISPRLQRKYDAFNSGEYERV